MKRRRFLKVTAGTVLGASLLQPRFAASAPLLGSDRCRPGDVDWPSDELWAQLARNLQGRLVKPEPLEASVEDLHNPFFLQSNPAAAQSQGWMGGWRFGNSVYAVEAESAADVSAAVRFAAKHRLRLVVRGGGHDYLGRSNAPDSLLIWTHKMRETRFQPSFVAAGSGPAEVGVPALQVSAGTRWLEAYGEATTRNGRYVQGGGCTSVGAAGGFIQGGGFGSFSKKFGTAAAGLLEAEVVTADGDILTVNRFQHPDLFWALRGGGGGTFGVVTRLTLKTHELPSNFGLLQGTITARDDEAFQQLLTTFVGFYRDALNNEHWGEQIAFKANNSVELYLVFQGVSRAEAEQVWQPFRAALDPALFRMDATFWEIPAQKMWDPDYWDSAHPGFITRNPRPEAPKGQFWWSGNQGEAFKYWYAYQSWWLPSQLFEDAERLASLFFEASRAGSCSLHINKGLAGGTPAALGGAQETCVHPSAYRASGLVIMAAGSNQVYLGVPGKEPDPVYGQERVEAIQRAMRGFLEAAPEAGCYANEADYFQDNWQEAFWGSHYPRLLEMKKRYDPDGLFYGHHNVGSEFWSGDGMRRV